METKEIICLDVKTVPAFDIETHMPHTAYTVSCMLNGGFAIASGWVLRDAIELFRLLYCINENVAIRLTRSFRHQKSQNH